MILLIWYGDPQSFVGDRFGPTGETVYLLVFLVNAPFDSDHKPLAEVADWPWSILFQVMVNWSPSYLLIKDRNLQTETGTISERNG